jgi:fucose permease
MILAALGGMALIGLIFTVPQYSQGVLGLDPEGSGVRLLPIILGLIAGAVPADRVAARVGPKFTVATGFAITTAGLLIASTTTIDSSAWFVVAWEVVIGFGMGVGFATAASAALKTVPADKSGVASALLQAMQKVGAPFGSAILGSVVVTVYRSSLDLGGLPPSVSAAVKLSLFAGVAAAEKLHSPALLESVRNAFVQGMDEAFVVSAAIAAVATLLALIFLPGRTKAVAHTEARTVQEVA